MIHTYVYNLAYYSSIFLLVWQYFPSALEPVVTVSLLHCRHRSQLNLKMSIEA